MAKGICPTCKVRPSRRGVYCVECRVVANKRDYARLRLQVITHYGGKCACCGEVYLEFLALDHVAGKGKEHRKTIGAGHAFWRWFINNAYPKGYRVLCHNCNSALGFYGYCPHQKGVKVGH